MIGILIESLGQSGKSVAALNNVGVGSIRRHQVQVRKLLFKRLVFAQCYRQSGPQRNTFRTEERELLLYAFNNARKPVTPLISGCVIDDRFNRVANGLSRTVALICQCAQRVALKSARGAPAYTV